MTTFLRRCLFALALSFTFPLRVALAEEAPPGARPRLDATASGSLVGAASSLVRSDVGLAFHVHLLPWLKVGARGTYASEFVPFEDPGERTVGYTTLDFLARAEAHARPSKTVDPYAGLGLGAMLSWQGRSEPGRPSTGGNIVRGSDPPDGVCRVDDRCWFPLATLDLGVDFHVHRAIALGPYIAGRVPVPTVRRPYYPMEPGLTVLPAIRLVVSF